MASKKVKFVQISSTDNGLYGLDANGSVWKYAEELISGFRTLGWFRVVDYRRSSASKEADAVLEACLLFVKNRHKSKLEMEISLGRLCDRSVEYAKSRGQ
jgi:hypothetical protein